MAIWGRPVRLRPLSAKGISFITVDRMGGRISSKICTSFIIHELSYATKQSAGITVEGATPPRGGLIARHCTRRLTLSGDAPATKRVGSLPPPAPLSYCAPFRRRRGGPARRSLASSFHIGGGKSVSSRVQCGVRRKSSTTTASAPPSEREALWLLKACST